MKKSMNSYKKDLSTLMVLVGKFVPVAEQLPSFKIYQQPGPCTGMGFGANAIYTSEIDVPVMSRVEEMRMGIRGSMVTGMVWVTSHIWPHNEEGPYMNKTVRTYTIHCEFKAIGRYTQRTWEGKVFAKFYDYSTEIGEVVGRFGGWFEQKFEPLQRSIVDKTYRWNF